MTSKTKKTILLIILAIVLGGVAFYIYKYQWNKPPVDAASSKPAYTISAPDLHNAFATDSATAKKYIGDESNEKVIQVSGVVVDVKENDLKQTVANLKTNTDGAFVQCTFKEKPMAVTAGATVQIKGLCAGYNFDADLGLPGDVQLVKCVEVK